MKVILQSVLEFLGAVAIMWAFALVFVVAPFALIRWIKRRRAATPSDQR